MLTVLLFSINFIIAILGIYVFDYQVDSLINKPFVIILSILAGWIVMLFLLVVYTEITFLLFAKNKPKTSMVKHKLATQMLSMPLHLLNMRMKIVGKENLPSDPGFSIYVNHTSMMDVPLLMYKLYDYPVAFLEKEIVAKAPFIGKWTPELGCVTIDRSNDRKGAESIINVIKNVKSGLSMVIFPEGTRNKEVGSLLEFKQGSFKVALKSKAPLVPITIVKPKNYNQIKWPFKRRVTVVVHKPIAFEDYKNMKTLELSKYIEKIIASSLNTIY